MGNRPPVADGRRQVTTRRAGPAAVLPLALLGAGCSAGTGRPGLLLLLVAGALAALSAWATGMTIYRRVFTRGRDGAAWTTKGGRSGPVRSGRERGGPNAGQVPGIPAALWRRVTASVCELIPPLLVAGLFLAAIPFSGSGNDSFGDALGIVLLVGFVVFLLFPLVVLVQSIVYGIVEGRGRATLGQHLLGIRVLGHDGGSLGVGRALVRRFLAGLVVWAWIPVSLAATTNLAPWAQAAITAAPPLASFLSALTNLQRCTWYDLLSGAVVIGGRPAPITRETTEPVGALDPARPRPAWGPRSRQT